MRTSILLVLLFISRLAMANEVSIVKAEMSQSGDRWNASVTLRHNDTGWEHYADAWRVVTPKGEVLATRTLYHPHENEQPFTRSLGNISIPDNINEVYIEAHDKVHGWSEKRYRIELKR